jgi:uncharacterized membrane protein (UPF0127 family)
MKKPAYAKGLAFFVASTLLLWAVCGFILFGNKSNSCKENYRNDKRVTINGHILKTQVAKTEVDREKGLGSKKCIEDNQAMLFEFEESGYYPFWMKDMKFPIDIIWLDSNKKVVTTKTNILPSTYPRTFTNTKPAQYVLELKAGNTNNLDISNKTNVSF